MGADMELVRQFNSEMASIYEQKPPISKAKMASITRFAVKALKYYKHIVHSVEKYLHKCHPDYKLPGLYVLDSIIRQSRHQFGIEKDLFGPRFQKNIILLFQNIYQCPQEEKPKVVRVLNLWQRNGIYPPEVISPLVDMASTSSKVLSAAINKHKKKVKAKAPDLDDSSHFDQFDNSLPLPIEPMPLEMKKDKKNREKVQMSQDDEIQVLKAQLEQQRKQQELLQQQLQMQIMATKQQALQLQLQQQQMQNKIQEQMQQNTIESFKSNPTEQPAAAALATQNNNQMQLLSQIQELTQQLEKDKAALASLTNTEVVPALPQVNTADNHSQFLENFQQLIQSAKGIMLKDPRQQQQQQNDSEEGKSSQEESSPKFNQSLLDTFEYDDEENVGDEQRILEQKARLEEEQNRLKRQVERDRERERRDPRSQNNEDQPPHKKQHIGNFEGNNDTEEQTIQQNLSQDDDAMQIDNDSEEYNEDELYQPEQSIEELDRPWPPIEINRREDRNVVEEEQERAAREAREKAREAEKKAREIEENWKKEKSVIPPPMMNRVTVASTTLWIGRLPRGIHPGVLQNMFSDYGEVKNIDMIEMRGCAFVTMASRFNADRALRYLRNKRIDGCDVKMAWGQPKNMQEFSKFWEEPFGCSFIPWGAFKPFHLRLFMDGSIVDKDSLPPGLDLPINAPNKAPPPEETPPPSINPLMPPRHQFNRMPNPGMPPHGLPPGMPHPDMLPPPPPMMPPGFRGQLPPLPMPGMLPLGMRPPMPPGGFPPWPCNLPTRGLPPGLPGGLQNIPKPPLLPDQVRTHLQNGREGISLLPPPPPIPGAPNVRVPFPRPDDPVIHNIPGRPGFIPIPRLDAPLFNRPPAERPRFQPPQPEIRGSAVGPRGRIEPPGLPPVPPNLRHQLWPPANNTEKKEVPPPQEKIPTKDFTHENGSNEIPEQSKDDKVDDKSERREEQGIDQNRANRGTPDKAKDERERKSRDDYRDAERNEKKERSSVDTRREERPERRDRDRDDNRRDRDDREERRERGERDERDRRERDYRNERNRKGRDERGERDYRNRDERERGGRERGGREKYGKDEFGRDESNRDDERGRREEFNREEDKTRRDDLNREDDKSRRRDRTPEKGGGKERLRESYKSDEVSSSSDKKELTPLDIKGQGLSGFKSTMQPISDKSDGKTSPQLPTVKSGFKSTMQPLGEIKPAAPVISTPIDEYKTIAPINKKNKAKSFVPFSIFPFPNQSDDDDESTKNESGKEEAMMSTKKEKMELEESSASGSTVGGDTEGNPVTSPKNDDLYDPLDDLASPPSPESSRGSHLSQRKGMNEDDSQDRGFSDSTVTYDSETTHVEDRQSSARDTATDKETRSPLDDTPPLDIFEDGATVGQSADIVTSSGDHSFSEKVSSKNISPVGQSSGIVSSSVDPPFKEITESGKQNANADNVTSSVDQVMDTSAHSDKSDADMVPMPSSTTINSSDTNKPCSTVAVCESSDNLASNLINEGSSKVVKENNLDCNKSPENNSQVSTSTSNKENVSSNQDVSSNSNTESVADGDEGTDKTTTLKDSETNSSKGTTIERDDK